MNPWEQIKQGLEHKLSNDAYRNWVMRTAQKSYSAGVLTVAVPDEATKVCMECDYADFSMQVSRDLGLVVKGINYEVGMGGNEPAPHRSDGMGENASVFNGDGNFASPASQLNARFTFDSFVVGPCNQFAHAAARAIATIPGRRYNPLFIYGGVGMGKTHLMHAIGRSLLDTHGSSKIVYTTSERFMSQMINCIKVDRMSQFHQHYRSADILLIDDIQVIAGKERTQEEFFHTFNELYDHQKQIVISSDSTPKSMPGLVERLRSRFEWGLMVDVQPPDLETKMAILDKKADEEGVHLPEDVRIFIATKTKTNVRELEGALVRLLAYSSISGVPVTLGMAQQILKHMITSQQNRVTIEAVMKAVAERFGLQPAQLKQKSNSRQIAYPRQIAMYLAKDLTHASLPEIGRAFGGKHHTTVLHSIQKIEQLRANDPDLNRLLHSISDTFH